ncbi:HD-GYP domain-containing protein [Chitinibacteraceae bacterium HSL-7]
MSEALPKIAVQQLTVGLYVHLDLDWMHHPFSFSSFRIRSEDQIRQIAALGLHEISYDPRRSSAQPLPTAPSAAPPPPVIEASPPAFDPIRAAKEARVARLAAQREALAKAEREFAGATTAVKALTRNVFARPGEAHAQASALIGQLVDSLLMAEDVAIQLMNDRVAGEEVYLHSLNVTVLTMILARQLQLSGDDIKRVALGALFHDIGKLEIPDRVLLKTDPLTRAEQQLVQQHCEFGLKIGTAMALPPAVLAIIAQHHEALDGSGYPRALKGDTISRDAALVAVVNHYDNRCNPVDPLAAVTPHEALAGMFAQCRGKLAADAMNAFIKLMGVYPPGTIVQLSNDMTGMVVSVNSQNPLRPSVLVYDALVPKDEAIITDLADEPDLNISRALRPRQLPKDIYDYLSPKKRITYYFDQSGRGT